jgi:hypothetical protein
MKKAFKGLVKKGKKSVAKRSSSPGANSNASSVAAALPPDGARDGMERTQFGLFIKYQI